MLTLAPNQQQDVAELVSRYQTDSTVITNLLAQGVSLADLDDVLRIRQEGDIILCDTVRRPKIENVDRISVTVLVKAYTIVDGDIDELERIGDRARVLAGETASYKGYGFANDCFKSAIQWYQRGCHDNETSVNWDSPDDEMVDDDNLNFGSLRPDD